MMGWLLQLSAALLGLAVLLITIAFLVHMALNGRPDARMAFLVGLMKDFPRHEEGECGTQKSQRRVEMLDSKLLRFVGK